VDAGHADGYDKKKYNAEMMNKVCNINNHLTDINSLILKTSVICVYIFCSIFSEYGAPYF
jgi:hypothetical protein